MGKVESEAKLPYQVNIEVFNKILDDLKSSGSDGVSLLQLWKDIGESDNKLRSFPLKMATYLGLVQEDGSKIWLTPLGKPISFMSPEKKKIHLIKNLPPEYLMMAKWILHAPSHQLMPAEIKAQLSAIQSTTSVMTNLIVQSFLRYAEYIGLINRIGRGPMAKVVLTSVGIEVLSTPAGQDIPVPVEQGVKASQEPLAKTQRDLTPAAYLIRIMTPDRQFEYDIRTDKDLEVVKSVFASIENDWNEKKGKKGEKKLS